MSNNTKTGRQHRGFLSLTTGIVIAGITLAGAHGVKAETLRDALRSAYKHNPQLDAERANLRATDESVPQALSDYRPLVNLSADASVQETNIRPGTPPGSRRIDGTSFPRGYSVAINQQVFRGFQTRNAVNSAEATVRAGRETLRNTEQTTLLAAATAFMNVVRDTSIVKLRENNVRVLSRNLKATQDRFSVGEVTRTDVAQSRARRAQAVSDLDLARSNLKTVRANFEQVIGHVPRRLREAAPPFSLLPKSLAEARRRAEQENPTVVAALYNEQAARFNVDLIAGQLLPTFNLDASYSNRFTGSGDIPRTQTETGILTGTLVVPLYQRGLVSSQVRQTKHLHVQAIQLVEQARTQAREALIAAWAQVNASRAQLRSTTSQVNANRIALSGVREEEKVGQRTLLDVLDAEQELLLSEVNLVSNRRDLVVNAYSVISATGRLTAQDLSLASKIYDSEAHYSEIRRKWYGISITHRDGRREQFQASQGSLKDARRR